MKEKWQNINVEIKQLKGIIFVFIALFALTPCTVKESIYQTFDAEYNQPINPSKSTLSESDCRVSPVDNSIYSSILNKHSFTPHTIGVSTKCVTIQELSWRIVKSELFDHAKLKFSTHPPLYILFSRLKIALI